MQLTISSITKKYRKNYALKSVTAQLSQGVYGLLGANGAGKTTLINILIGVLEANSGDILFNGTNIKKLGTKYLELIGYMPQYPRFYPNFRVDEFLDYLCCVKDIPRKAAPAIIEEVLWQVNLTPQSRKRICELSGGMRQRVGIAQAMLNEPKILILDEPTAGLDPAERIRFRNIISRISKDRIVLIATHIVQDVEYIANEVMILKEGFLVQKGSIAELCRKENGRVWEAVLSEQELTEAMEQFLIGNMRREGDKIRVRLISEAAPGRLKAIPAAPQLEDVFFDIFGKDGANG